MSVPELTMKCKIKTSAGSFKKERSMRHPPSSFFCFLSILLGSHVPKLTSLMHDLIVKRCGEFWPQPTTPSIKYGTVTFKAMLNVPDTWGEGKGRLCGIVGVNVLNFRSLGPGVIMAAWCLTHVHVYTSLFRFISRKYLKLATSHLYILPSNLSEMSNQCTIQR